MDIEIEDQRDALDLSTQGEETHATSYLAPTSTTKMVGASIKPDRPSAVAPAIGMIIISSEFLQSLVDGQRAIADRLKVIEIEITTLFE